MTTAPVLLFSMFPSLPVCSTCSHTAPSPAGRQMCLKCWCLLINTASPKVSASYMFFKLILFLSYVSSKTTTTTIELEDASVSFLPDVTGLDSRQTCDGPDCLAVPFSITICDLTKTKIYFRLFHVRCGFE